MNFHARCSINSRDFFLLLVLIATLSLILNLQLSYYENLRPGKGPMADSFAGYDERALTDTGNTFVKLASVRDLYALGRKALAIKKEVHTYVETVGKDINGNGQDVVEDGRSFRRSLSQHDNTDGGNANDGAVNENIRTRLKKIEKQLKVSAAKPIAVVIGDASRVLHVVRNLSGQRQKFVYRNMGLTWLDGKTLVQGNWSVLLCAGGNRSCQQACIDTSQQVLQMNSPIADVGRRTELLCAGANENYDHPGSLDGRVICSYRGGPNSSLPKDKDEHVYIQYKAGREFIWHLPKKPIDILGGNILRSQVLVSGNQPLRVYVHQTILVGSYESPSFSISNSSKHSVDDVLQAVSETYGLGSVSKLWSRFQSTVSRGVRKILELSNHDADIGRCERFYQLFDVDIMCVTIQSCFISQVLDTDCSSHTFENVISLLTSDALDVEEMANALEYTELYSRIQDEDLMYLLDWRQEQKFLNEWISLTQTFSDKTSDRETSRALCRHSAITTLTSYFSTAEGPEQEPQYSAEIPSVSDDSDAIIAGKGSINCSQETISCGAVDSIIVSPMVSVYEISNKTFEVHVPYETVLIRLHVIPKGCQCQARLDNMYYAPGARNFTLGLGETVIRAYIMNKDQSITSTATITFHRQGRPSIWLSNNKILCGLKQDCDLLYAPDERCGYSTMSTIGSQLLCKSGDTPGQWVVPCTDCQKGEGCTWIRATWQPDGCSYQQFSKPRLKQCLRGRRLLFIGDSTNRGVANYVLEQINDTLHDWDKTHTTRVYHNVNHNRTLVAFSYYPHFWLPANHRPSFKKVLYQLVKRSLPLENNTNSVLVVGGVQWISKQHIDLIVEALQRKGLSGITTVIKGLGAGFNLPVESMRYVPPHGQPELYQREVEVLVYAKQHGFNVAATFNMTASRHRDFLEGQCACHFHKVRKIAASDATSGYYTVEGDVNAAYSQIILNQIC